MGVRNLLNHGKTVFVDRISTSVSEQPAAGILDLQEDILAYSRDAGLIDGMGGEDNERDRCHYGSTTQHP